MWNMYECIVFNCLSGLKIEITCKWEFENYIRNGCLEIRPSGPTILVRSEWNNKEFLFVLILKSVRPASCRRVLYEAYSGSAQLMLVESFLADYPSATGRYFSSATLVSLSLYLGGHLHPSLSSITFFKGLRLCCAHKPPPQSNLHHKDWYQPPSVCCKSEDTEWEGERRGAARAFVK